MKYSVDMYFWSFFKQIPILVAVCIINKDIEYSKRLLIREIFTKNVSCL